MNVKEISSFTDYMLICSGSTDRQVQAISSAIQEYLKKEDIRPLGVEGESNAEWILLDYDDVVISVFQDEARSFYGLEDLWDAPRMEIDEKATEINGVQIVQAGIGTNQIGRFDIMVDTDRNCIDSFTWKTIPICAENCPRDEEVESLILNYKKATDEKYGRIVTRFTRELTHPSRTQETELGDLFADILQNALGLDVFFIGSGSIRSTKLGPVVRLSDFEECFPYDDAVFLVKVTGAQLKKMILFYLRDEAFEGDHTEFYQISGGLRLIYEKKEHTFREIKFGGADVDDSRIYSTGIQAFHYANFEKFFGLPQAEIEKNAAPRPVATSCRSILEEVLSGSHLLDQKADGRITIE